MQVYLVHNRINQKVYVGATTATLSARWQQHCWEASVARRRCALHGAITKYGEASFEVSRLSSATSRDDLYNLERLFIILFRSGDRARGYNMTNGGEGVTGSGRIKKQSEDTKRKISVALAGRVPHKAVAAAAEFHRGRPISMDHKRKLSAIHKGRGPSPEARAKAAVVLRLKWQRDGDYRSKMTMIARNQQRQNPNASHCVNGHEWTASNISHYTNGRRRCLVCNRESCRRCYLQQKRRS